MSKNGYTPLMPLPLGHANVVDALSSGMAEAAHPSQKPRRCISLPKWET